MTRILVVVDDQAFVRNTIRSMLADNKTGWQLCEAENGKVAVDVTKQKKPDVVVLDLVMPVMGRLAAGYEIGNIAPDAKIVFISSHCTLDQASSLTRLFGASCFVPKSEKEKNSSPQSRICSRSKSHAFIRNRICRKASMDYSRLGSS